MDAPTEPSQPIQQHSTQAQPLVQNSIPAIPKEPLFKRVMPIILVVGGIAFGVGLYAVISSFMVKPPNDVVTTVVVSPTPSPTPFRYPTEVSTGSAFLLLEQNLSSFSATLREFSKDDPSLTPPNLVLPIGL